MKIVLLIINCLIAISPEVKDRNTLLPLIILIFVGVRISYLIWYRQNNICIRCKGIGGLNEYDQYLKINLKNIPCYCCNGKGKVHKNVSEFYNATKRAKKRK